MWNNIKSWIGNNAGLVQVIQFFTPILISLLSLRFIKNKRPEPVLILDIKNADDYDLNQRQKIEEDGYFLGNSGYFLRIRNEGNDIALNVYAESDQFEIIQYENNQVGLQDEISLKIVRKKGDPVGSPKEMDGSIFKLYCETVSGNGFHFKYQIIDTQEQKVRFLDKGHGKNAQNKGNFRLDSKI